MFSLLSFLLSVFWLLLTIGVLVNLWRNEGRPSSYKLLWTLGILFFPFLGPLGYILFGDRIGS